MCGLPSNARKKDFVSNCESVAGTSRFTKKRIFDLDPSSRTISSLCLDINLPIDPVIGRDIEGESNVTLIIKAGYKVGGVSLGAQEERIKFSGQESMDAFWNSTDWITRRL